jgi:hypothetical protein
MKALSPARSGLLVLMVFPVLAIAMGLFLWEPVWLFHRSALRAGNEIVARVEAYRVSHGRLPEALKDVGIDDPDLKVFYRKVGDDEYWVWFGRYSLGESETYSSRTKKWE